MRFKSAALILSLVIFVPVSGRAQREHQIPVSQDSDYGGKFFEELGRIFGRFRDADLQRVFESARPIQCSELVTDKGEWREVAFFNENRKLGAWYRKSLDEVKADLAVYTFKGACGGQRASVQVTTEFPIQESIKRFEDGRIRFEDIDVDVNAPVSGVFDPKTQAYVFELPYLFHVTREDGESVYTLNPNRVSDRYAKDVTNRWECKAVAADDVTYQFLICHSNLLPRDPQIRAQERNRSFGASAYSILSDGKEASSTVKLSFGAADSTAPSPAPEPKESLPAVDARPVEERAWGAVASEARLTDVGLTEFRLRFKPESWKGKIDQPLVIADGNLATSGSVPRSKDYCVWKPRARAQTGQLLEPSATDSIINSIEFTKQAQSTVSAVFEMQGDDAAIADLQCSFLQTQTPSDITVGRWMSIVGSTVALETPRKSK